MENNNEDNLVNLLKFDNIGELTPLDKNDKVKYCIVLNQNIEDFRSDYNELFLSKDNVFSDEEDNILYLTQEDALKVEENIEEQLKDLKYKNKYSVSIKGGMNSLPEHLFTEDEIKKEVEKIKDNGNWVFVIDENGFFKVLHFDRNLLYPVRLHSFHGIPSDYYDTTVYQELLFGFYNYLKTSNFQFINDEYIEESSNGLIEKIKSLLTNQ